MISGHGTEKLLSMGFEILGLGDSEVSVLSRCRKMGCDYNLTLICFYSRVISLFSALTRLILIESLLMSA